MKVVPQVIKWTHKFSSMHISNLGNQCKLPNRDPDSKFVKLGPVPTGNATSFVRLFFPAECKMQMH